MEQKKYYFDVEIITDTKLFKTINVATHERYRGLTLEQLLELLNHMSNTYEIDTTINIRGVNY